MDSTGLLAAFRNEVDDAVAPYLWSDAEVLGYMDDAQKMFCRKTEGIEDARTPSVCTVSVVPGTVWYDTSPLILKIRRVTREDNGRQVRVINPEHLYMQGMSLSARTGPLHCVVRGLSVNTLRPVDIPNEAVTLNLAVFRLPLDPIEGKEQELEIDEQHHRALLMWMKHLAYGKQDADTSDSRQSAEYMQKFLGYCADARVEQERARREVGCVTYGGL